MLRPTFLLRLLIVFLLYFGIENKCLRKNFCFLIRFRMRQRVTIPKRCYPSRLSDWNIKSKWRIGWETENVIKKIEKEIFNWWNLILENKFQQSDFEFFELEAALRVKKLWLCYYQSVTIAESCFITAPPSLEEEEIVKYDSMFND